MELVLNEVIDNEMSQNEFEFKSTIKGIVFDLDNTLYAYKPCNHAGIDALCRYANRYLKLSDREFLDAYLTGQKETKTILDSGASQHSRLLYIQHALEKLNLPLVPHAVAMEEVFWQTFLSNMVLFDGAEDLLRKLHEKKIPLAICSDLTTAIQLRKLEKLGIAKYFSAIVTSEEVGIEKPDKKMFAQVAYKLKIAPRNLLMIGDDYSKDIMGAKDFGLKTLWFNPEQLPQKDSYSPTVEFTDYRKNFLWQYFNLI